MDAMLRTKRAKVKGFNNNSVMAGFLNFEKLKKSFKYFILILWGAVTLYPIFFTLMSSLKSENEFLTNIFGLPKNFTFDNYINLFTTIKMGTNILNSLFISITTLILQLTISTMAAFILSRFEFKYKNAILSFLMLGLLIPVQSVLIPIAVIAKYVNGYNSFAFVIITYIAFGLAYYTFMIQGFMKGIPKEIEEAAIVDGCPASLMFVKIIVPLSKPAISTAAILSFFGAWNELMIGLIILKKQSMQTVSLALISFANEQYAVYAGQAAAVIVAVIPTLLVYLILQENVIEGMTAGAVKG
jgi:raffinose/stachyose/melibiose transport system permease protein